MRTSPILAAALLAAGAAAQDFRVLDPSADPHPEGMLTTYLKGIARKQLASRRDDVAAIRDKAGYEKRKARNKAAALKIVGGLDDPRNPLNARTTGTLDRDGYRVEKVIYESRPRFFVTANLYVPKTGRAPFPAVLQPVGHSTSAKNRAFYQRIAIALVKTGFVVLTYDPIGQGERRIFWDAALGDSKVNGTTGEHSMVGWQSVLGGESAARFRIWDGMRSIDYLISRPEVDRARIGVTGCSGGGTLTTYIAALDDRVAAAAPACYISDWEDQLEGTGPQDAEQQFPDQLLEGLNHADWIGMAAPKPYLIVSTDQDFFPLEGARKTFAEIQRVWTLYDARAKAGWFHEPGGHGVPDASREAICAWMHKWLGAAGPVHRGEIATEYEEDLNATPTGQVATSLGGETASTWNTRRFANRVPPRREPPPKGLREEVAARIRRQPSTVALDIRRSNPIEGEGMRVEPFTYRSAEGLTIPALLCGASGKPALFLDSRGKANAIRSGDVPRLVKMGYRVLAIDVSGVGEVEFRRHEGTPWGFPQVAWLALMVGRPLVGIRVNDIARGVDAMLAMGVDISPGVEAFSVGRLGTALLHAAALDPRIAAVTIEQNLASYRLAGASPIHRDLEDSIVPGVLGKYDLPDLAAAIAPRPVTVVNAVWPTGRLLLRKEVEAEYEFTSRAFRAAGAPGAFRVALRREGEPLLAR